MPSTCLTPESHMSERHRWSTKMICKELSWEIVTVVLESSRILPRWGWRW